MNKGWECPRCGRCYAPSVQKCMFCGGNNFGAPYPQYPITWVTGTGTATTSEGHTYTVNNVYSPPSKFAGIINVEITKPDQPEDPDDFHGAAV